MKAVWTYAEFDAGNQIGMVCALPGLQLRKARRWKAEGLNFEEARQLLFSETIEAATKRGLDTSEYEL